MYARGVFDAASVTPGIIAIALTARESGIAESGTVHRVLPNKLTFGVLHQALVFYWCMRYFRGCDIIHTCFERPMIGAALAARLTGARLVMTIHGTYAVPPTGSSLADRIKRTLMRFAYRTAAKCTTGSFKTEERVREVIGNDLKECRFIPNGYDPKTFYRDPSITRQQRLLSVGWLKSRKGFDIVIRVLGMLKEEFPDLTYTIIGGDDDTENMEYYHHLQKIAQEVGVASRVTIRAGKITRANLAKEYNACKVFVLTSRDSGHNFEGFPLVYMEAQACGAPVVTTRGYGSNYAIREGDNGYLVDSEDVAATADAVRKIIADPEVYHRMSKCALERASEHTWPLLFGQILRLYHDALA